MTEEWREPYDKCALRKLIEQGKKTVNELVTTRIQDWSDDVIFVMNGGEKTELTHDHINLFFQDEKRAETRPNPMPNIFKDKNVTLVRWDHALVTGPKVICFDASVNLLGPQGKTTTNHFSIIERNTFGESQEFTSFTIAGDISFNNCVQFQGNDNVHVHVELSRDLSDNEILEYDNSEYKTGFQGDESVLTKNNTAKYAYLVDNIPKKYAHYDAHYENKFNGKVFVQYTDKDDIDTEPYKYYGYGSFHVAIPMDVYDSIYDVYKPKQEKYEKAKLEQERPVVSGGNNNRRRRSVKQYRKTRRRSGGPTRIRRRRKNRSRV